MQRSSIVAEIFGYLICLFTVAVFFVSVAGIINGAFRVANPAAQRIVMQRFGGPMGAGHARRIFSWTGGAGQTAGTADRMDGRMAAAPRPNVAAMHARVTADARYNAVRGLVVAIVMLILSIVVFRRTLGWIGAKQAPAP